MRGTAHGRTLTCATCHDVHALDTRRAATDACLGCHDDRHSRSYAASKHARLGAGAPPGRRVPAGAVTCATCHMPRVRVETDEGTRVAVTHNNSFTLRPRDRMAKDVCQACHGFEFGLTSVLDEGLVASNFQGRPAARHRTFQMIEGLLAEERAAHERERKETATR
jgi:hypothetical protein